MRTIAPWIARGMPGLLDDDEWRPTHPGEVAIVDLRDPSLAVEQRRFQPLFTGLSLGLTTLGVGLLGGLIGFSLFCSRHCIGSGQPIQPF